MHYCKSVGDDRLKEILERKYNIKLGRTRRGRPVTSHSVSN